MDFKCSKCGMKNSNDNLFCGYCGEKLNKDTNQNINLNTEEIYVPKYKPIEKGSKEWYLYHSPKNGEGVAGLIPISIFLFFCKKGIIVIIAIWLFQIFKCWYNNNELNKDPRVLKKREEYKEMRRIYDPRDPKYQTKEYLEYKSKYPARCPGTPEFEAAVERFRKIIYRDL